MSRVEFLDVSILKNDSPLGYSEVYEQWMHYAGYESVKKVLERN